MTYDVQHVSPRLQSSFGLQRKHENLQEKQVFFFFLCWFLYLLLFPFRRLI